MIALAFAIGDIGAFAYTLRGKMPSAGFRLMYLCTMSWSFAAWALADRRRLRLPISVDYGWFYFYAWPLLVPYHALKTRGWRGLLTIGGFVALWLAFYAVALVVWYVVQLSIA